MSETKTSQVREAQNVWKKLCDEHVARMEQAFGEVGKYESQGLDYMRTAADEAAKLQKDTIAYYAQLSAEWRKLTLEATRKAAELMTFQG
jgi:hypothetical protein